MRDDIATGLIGLITQTPEMHQYIVHKLYSEIKKLPQKHSMLLQVGVWCIGEYGDFLLDDSQGEFPKISKESVIDTLVKLLDEPFTTPNVQALIITCLSKLGTRFNME
jgi:AP-1 complex subunit gamma-1